MAVKLEEYKGYYSIVSGYRNKQGEWKWNGCRPQKWNKDTNRFEEAEKIQPLRVQLGTKEEAVQALKDMLAELSGGTQTEKEFNPDEDTPF